jgi:hypothetical protein
MRPRPIDVEGRTYVILAEPDWLSTGGYILALQRQLTAACLALGGTEEQCRSGW